MLSLRDKIKNELENKQIAPAEEFQSSRKRRKRSTSKETPAEKKISKEKL